MYFAACLLTAIKHIRKQQWWWILHWAFTSLKSAYRRCYYKLQMSYLSHEISFLPHSQQLVRRPHSVSRYLWGALPVGVTQVWCCSCSFLYWSTNSHSQSPSSLQSPAHPEPKHRRNLSLLRGGWSEPSRCPGVSLRCLAVVWRELRGEEAAR